MVDLVVAFLTAYFDGFANVNRFKKLDILLLEELLIKDFGNLSEILQRSNLDTV